MNQTKMGDSLSTEQYGNGGGHGDSEYNLGEARRQIHALWQKFTDLNDDTKNNVRELANIQAQNNYMVRLLEKIDASNQLALPRCAERGVKIDDLQKCCEESRERLDDIEPELESLKATQRTLKWVAGIISAVIVGVCLKMLNA